MIFLVCFAIACRGVRETPAVDREPVYQANNLGVALLEQFKYEEAAAAFQKALALDPALGILHVNLSLARLYFPDLDGAAREASEAARLLPSAPQPPYILGLIARAQNRNEEAIRFFERVRQIDPGDVGTNTNLGQILLQERRYAEAVAMLRSALAEEPYNVTAAYNLGMALMRGGEREEGQRMLEHSQALRASGYAVTYGTGYLEQGRYAEAMASTGAEPELVDPAVPAATFTPAVPGSATRADAGRESPFGRRFSTSELTTEGARTIAAALGGCVTPIDFDGDGDLDLFEASADRQHLMLSDGTGAATVLPSPSGPVPIGCLAGDYDNDGAPDLFVLRHEGSSLYRNDGKGRFRDVTAAAKLPAYPFLPGAAAFVDVDHDGDLDLIVAGLADLAATRSRGGAQPVSFPREFAPAPLQLLRNNGNGTFTDTTRDARLDARAHAIAIVPTDFDNRRDIDLLVVNHDARPLLFKNLRDGTFRDVAADVGLTDLGADITSVAAADVNNDDFTDFFFANTGGGVFASSDARGRFTLTPAPGGAAAAVASRFIDYDNDGLLDLLRWSDGPHMLRNLGQQWSDVTERAFTGSAGGDGWRLVSARGLAVADIDGDGDSDLVTGGAGPLTRWRNSGDSGRRSLRVRTRGVVSNRTGIGAKLQLRAGSLKGRFETSAASPAVAPGDIVFGLGGRSAADVVRVLWPSGVLQAEAAGTGPMFSIEELNRKPSSCPFLFTWNGTRFEFVTDFMGGGEMGYLLAPGTLNHPDPVEYVRIRGDQLQPKNGRFEIRVTNELEEAMFLDRLALIAIAHPREIDVFPNEGMTSPPKPVRLHAVREARVPGRMVDDHGHDMTDRLARVDRRYPDDFALAPIRGYAAEHTLTIDLDSAADPVLLLTAWTDYAFSSDNLAASQAGLSLAPPSLQIKDARGVWRTAIPQIGIPVGRPQTIAVDLSSHLRPGDHQLRIVTNMRIYWDQILVATRAASGAVQTRQIEPHAAALKARGFSKEVSKNPVTYQYEPVMLASPWKAMAGAYTREGDVRGLLMRADDLFVIAMAGDEIAVSFDAAQAGAVPPGWTRTFLLLSDGFSKEMDINSASPDTVEPLPFHGMSRYPYAPPERYPDTPAHRRYRETFNTRIVGRQLPPLVNPEDAQSHGASRSGVR